MLVVSPCAPPRCYRNTRLSVCRGTSKIGVSGQLAATRTHPKYSIRAECAASDRADADRVIHGRIGLRVSSIRQVLEDVGVWRRRGFIAATLVRASGVVTAGRPPMVRHTA